ncbi:MAG: response regulator [Anaerolineales bacterium]|nr:response regulator [Anaerolineales bacterium]
MTPEAKQARLALIVGDEDLLGLIQVLLASETLDLRVATSGRTGLELIRDDAPDLILLDLALPDMNGWEFFMHLHAGDERTPAPVIILATQASRVDRTFGLRVAQAHDFLVKPFLPSQLRRSVQTALQLNPPPQFRHAVSQTGA